MRKRTEITLERERVLVIRGGGSPLRWCTFCSREVPMLGIDEAALLAQVSSRTIFHWADGGLLHTEETVEGLLLICGDSLSLSEERS